MMAAGSSVPDEGFRMRIPSLYEPDRMRRLGFEYYLIGRKPALPA